MSRRPRSSAPASSGPLGVGVLSSRNSQQPIFMSSSLQVFPTPMSPAAAAASPGASSPLLAVSAVTQLQQLSVLMALCAAVPNTHALVAHDLIYLEPLALSPVVPRPLSLLEHVLTENTTREELSAILLHADTNLAVADNRGGASSASRFGAQSSSSGAPSMTITPQSSMSRGPAARTYQRGGHFRFPSTASSHEDESLVSAAQSGTTKSGDEVFGALPSASSDDDVVKIVLLHNLSCASLGVQDLLMDLLTYSLLTVNHTVRRAPSLRIVALCSSSELAIVPHHLRTAFSLSTYLSPNAVQSMSAFEAAGGSAVVARSRLSELCAAVMQMSPTTGSPAGSAGSIVKSWDVHRHGTRERENIVAAPFLWRAFRQSQQGAVGSGGSMPVSAGVTAHQRGRSSPLLHVYVSPSVEQYCRHLIGLIRGSLSPSSTASTIGMFTKCEHMLDVLRALVYLCQPINDDLRERRPIVGTTDVLCLLPCLTTHWLLLHHREFFPLIGPSATAAVVEQQTQLRLSRGLGGDASRKGGAGVSTATPPSSTPQTIALVEPSPNGYVGAIGLPLPFCSSWDAIAVSSAAASELQKWRCGNGGIPAETYVCDGAGSSMMTTHDAAGNALLDRSFGQGMPPPAAPGTSSFDGASSLLNETVRRPNTIHFALNASSFDTSDGMEGSSSVPRRAQPELPYLPYEWARHVVATTIRERAQPPPG